MDMQVTNVLEPYQLPTGNCGETRARAKLSHTSYGPPQIESCPAAQTRAQASQVAWLSVAAHLPPSQTQMGPEIAAANELRQLPREALVALAQKAKGCLPNDGTSAVDCVRQLRDEWEPTAG